MGVFKKDWNLTSKNIAVCVDQKWQEFHTYILQMPSKLTSGTFCQILRLPFNQLSIHPSMISTKWCRSLVSNLKNNLANNSTTAQRSTRVCHVIRNNLHFTYQGHGKTADFVARSRSHQSPDVEVAWSADRCERGDRRLANGLLWLPKNAWRLIRGVVAKHRGFWIESARRWYFWSQLALCGGYWIGLKQG